MKLEILFDSLIEEELDYTSSPISMKLKTPANFSSLINSKKEKDISLEFLIETKNQLVKDLTNDPEDILAIEALERINQEIAIITKYQNSLLTINDFDNIVIDFASAKAPLSEYQEFMESINGQIIIKAAHLSIEDLYTILGFNMDVEPQIEHHYNGLENVSLTEFIETLEIIEEMKEAIIKYKFSPIEQLLFLYDILKERVYKKCEVRDAHSRDLSKVLKEEEIVCLGYANIFAAVAGALNIPCGVKYYVSDRENHPGHATNICFTNDAKYDFIGCMEFDVTGDCKNNKKDNVINNYSWFCLSEVLSTKCKEAVHLLPWKSKYFLNPLYQKYKIYQDCLEYDYVPSLLQTQSQRLIKELKTIYLFFNDQETIKMLEELEKSKEIIPASVIDSLFDNLAKLFNKTLSFKTFTQSLYTVRRVQHSLNPKKYPLNANEITKAAKKRYNSERLLSEIIFNGKIPEIIKEMPLMGQIDDGIKNKIKYDAARMELLYALRRNLEKKEELNSLTRK